MLSKLLTDKSSNIYIQLFRYVLAGGTAFVVDFGLLYTLTNWLGVHYMVSTVISYTIGLIITYLLSIYWIFDKRRTNNRLMEFFIFSLIGLVGLSLTSFFMFLLTDILGIYYLLSKLATTIIVFIWKFIAKKFILFRG